MQAALRRCICLVVLILRVATAGYQVHEGVHLFHASLRTPVAAAPLALPASLAAAPAPVSAAKDAAVLPNSKFKIPSYNRADSLGAATNGYLDWFVVIYWGVVILLLLLVELVTHLRDGVPICHHQSESQLSKEVSSKTIEEAPGVAKERSEEFPRAASRSSFLLGPENAAGRSKDLAPNVWALNLVASHGKARDQRGNILSPRIVFTAGIAMGLLQLLTLFLVVYDIDPAASAYTVEPAAAWKRSALTVNWMKVIMTFFLGMYVVSEAADAYDNYLLGLALKEEHLLVHRFFVLFIPIFHYIITLSVVLAGVSVVLSCQDVPNILYNSMAILFITRVDELFWGFFERTFDIDAEWNVQLHESEIAEVQLLKKCIIMFPMMWGFCLLGRAWYRDQMPALVVRVHLNS